ncbi:MAG: flagellin [Archaeoglobus sp.]|nr:flagellin [Archaeoglobus sp.]
MKKLRKDEKGAIGIEILIVFIAIVLVAAVSAAVLIQTVGFLQQKALATGRETTKEVASGIKVTKVLGYVTSPRTSSATVDRMAIFVEVNTGGQDIDLTTTTLTLDNGSVGVMLTYDDDATNKAFSDSSGYPNIFNSSMNAWNYTSGNHFGIIVLQDEDGSLSADYPVLNSGDKVILTVNSSNLFSGIAPRTDVSGEVRPEFGAPGIIEFTTPPAYTDNVVELQ